MTSPHICLLGFGEVGQVFANDLNARGFGDLSAWDIQFDVENSAAQQGIARTDVRQAMNVADGVSTADIVISAVTAAQDLAAAQSVSAHLKKDAWFVDVNSVSPKVKREVSEVIECAGGRYIEVAIMSPISPRGIASPMLLGGPHAAQFLPLAHRLGLAGASVYSEQLGRASAAKMCRSVMVKGMEALLTESLVSARHYGVEDVVLSSLQDMFPNADWPKVSRYMISRSLIHGRRRAEEMREVARTVEEAGLFSWMSSACAQRQEWAAARSAATEHEDLRHMLDRLLALK